MKHRSLRAGERSQPARLVPWLQIHRAMQRLFLSGQVTCAMLLGAGLLLRAQAAFHSGTEAAPSALESPRTRPAELMAERARPAPRAVRSETTPAPRTVHRISHTRKGFAHQPACHRVRGSGVALAGRTLRCG